jgi:hypothetical protein
MEEPTLDKRLPACLGVVVGFDGDVVTALMAIKELFKSTTPARVITEDEVREDFLLTLLESRATQSLAIHDDEWPALSIRKSNYPGPDMVVDLITEARLTTIQVHETEDVSYCFDQVRFTRSILADDDGPKPFLIESVID